MTQYHDSIYSILASMYQTKHEVKPRRSLFALPPSLLRHIIQRSQASQTATINPTIPATLIPRSNETLGE